MLCSKNIDYSRNDVIVLQVPNLEPVPLLLLPGGSVVLRRDLVKQASFSLIAVFIGTRRAYGQIANFAFWQQKGAPANKSLWTWGSNTTGAIGHGPSGSVSSPTQIGVELNWAKVAAGYSHTVAIKGGELWSWGMGTGGQLGGGNQSSTSSPNQVGADTNWQDCDAGDNFTLVKRTDGTLWSCGFGSQGRLGHGNTLNYSSPTQIGSDTSWTHFRCGGEHSLSLKSDGTLWAWGRNTYGVLGNNEATLANISSPVQIGALTTWASIDCSGEFSGAVKSDGTLWMWGRNHLGQLGQDNTSPAIISSPIQVGALGDWSLVSTGISHALAIKTDGSLWAWGSNLNGRLGDLSTTNRSSPVQVGSFTDWTNITAGYSYSGGVRDAGTLWTWGYGNFGRLGDGATNDKSSPVQVGALTDWSFIESGRSHTVTIKK